MRKRKSMGRPIDGILLLDKPLGITSNAALQRAKHLFYAKKAGHTGSLDPLATGMLPICFGEATKFSQFLLDADKEYEVLAKLGVKTTTGDLEGEIIAEKPAGVTLKQVEKILTQFRGEIDQIPSMYSAIKKDGQPLYKLARQGIEVERKARQVTIHELELLNFSKDTLGLRVLSSKGTYIRSLVEDIGEALGCGAHVIELRRVHVDHYSMDCMVTLEQLETLKEEKAFQAMDDLLLPMESSVEVYPNVQLTAVSAFQLRQGNPVQIATHIDEGYLRLYDPQLGFIGVGEIDEEGNVAPRRLIKAK